MAAYWLPCPQCGERIRVETSQAGQTLKCVCGASVEAPTFRNLESLEPIVQAAPQTRRWNSKQGLSLLAAAIAFAALLGAGYIEWSVFSRVVRAKPEIAETAKREFDEMPPNEAWYVWQTLKLGLHDPNSREILMRQKRARFWQQALLVVAGASAAASVAFVVSQRKSARRVAQA